MKFTPFSLISGMLFLMFSGYDVTMAVVVVGGFFCSFFLRARTEKISF